MVQQFIDQEAITFSFGEKPQQIKQRMYSNRHIKQGAEIFVSVYFQHR